MSSEQSLNYCSYTVIKAFGGLVKFRAIDGNINNLAGMQHMPNSNPCYRTVFTQLEIVPALFYCTCNFLYTFQVQPRNCPRFSLGIFPAFYDVGEIDHSTDVSIVYVVVKSPACAQCRLGFSPCCFQFYTTASYNINIITILKYYDYIL